MFVCQQTSALYKRLRTNHTQRQGQLQETDQAWGIELGISVEQQTNDIHLAPSAGGGQRRFAVLNHTEKTT